MKTLILFAHPALEKSRVNKKLISFLPQDSSITLNDLYEEYPDFDIDVKREQQLLIENDLIIFHHPFYWYSTPAILKQWQDLVLEHGWAYGSKGTALVGKKFLNIVTTGGGETAYQKNSFNAHTVREFLLPIERTAILCGMIFLPPYLIQGTHKLNERDINSHASEYSDLLLFLSNKNLDYKELSGLETLNMVLNKNKFNNA